ncbi:MAG: cell division protein ZapB [Acidobacteria bacterium]|nr:cell division protein ZapB [Acidobacteriota bacterium]
MAKKESKKDDKQMELIGPGGVEMIDRLAVQVEKAIETIRKLRAERDDLVGRLEEAESRLGDLSGGAERLAELEDERETFEEQRQEVRGRIEKILEKLAQIDG